MGRLEGGKTTRAILELIMRGMIEGDWPTRTMVINDISEKLKISKKAVEKQLTQLYSVGIVRRETANWYDDDGILRKKLSLDYGPVIRILARLDAEKTKAEKPDMQDKTFEELQESLESIRGKEFFDPMISILEEEKNVSEDTFDILFDIELKWNVDKYMEAFYIWRENRWEIPKGPIGHWKSESGVSDNEPREKWPDDDTERWGEWSDDT